MAKQHLSARLEAETIAAVDAWAQAHGVTRTDALESLLSVGMTGTVAQEPDNNSAAVVEALRANLEDLRAQIVAKDKLIDRLSVMVGNAQALQAAAEARALEAARDADISADGDDVDQMPTTDESEAVDAPQEATGAVLSDDDGAQVVKPDEVPAQRLTLRQRLARWLLGE